MADWAAVAKVVNDRMAELGMTQRELIERSKVAPMTIRQIQQGVDRKRNRNTLVAISRALGLPDEHLSRVAAESHPGAGGGDEAEGATIADLVRELAALRDRVDVIETRLSDRD
ncbi:helix-turn-helix transcriptional regulator [Sphaerisporangium sp. NPDC051017]|uniref:helix-turn-helix transcriptional regulator n=1 Tax=Sphaerisporangium sp. NPDC051017 TaxID=3154636 RepID=UPI00344AE615